MGDNLWLESHTHTPICKERSLKQNTTETYAMVSIMTMLRGEDVADDGVGDSVDVDDDGVVYDSYKRWCRSFC